MLIQTVCLILPAPIIYAIARQLGATTAEAAMWATAYLVYPPLSHMHLGYSYGWHPVSLARGDPPDHAQVQDVVFLQCAL